MNLEEEGREREQTGLRNVPQGPTSCWWPGTGAWTEAQLVAGQAGGAKLGLLGIAEAAPHERQEGVRGCLTHKASHNCCLFPAQTTSS